MDLSPGGMRKLKQVHRSERARSLGELMVLVRGRSQAFPGGSLALALAEQLTPHLCLASQISQEQNFNLALDAGQDDAGLASRFGSRQLALCRDRPPPNSQGIPELLGVGVGETSVCGGRGGDKLGWTFIDSEVHTKFHLREDYGYRIWGGHGEGDLGWGVGWDGTGGEERWGFRRQGGREEAEMVEGQGGKGRSGRRQRA